MCIMQWFCVQDTFCVIQCIWLCCVDLNCITIGSVDHGDIVVYNVHFIVFCGFWESTLCNRIVFCGFWESTLCYNLHHSVFCWLCLSRWRSRSRNIYFSNISWRSMTVHVHYIVIYLVLCVVCVLYVLCVLCILCVLCAVIYFPCIILCLVDFIFSYNCFADYVRALNSGFVAYIVQNKYSVTVTVTVHYTVFCGFDFVLQFVLCLCII